MPACFYLFIFLHAAEGCFKNNVDVSMTASSGGSVVLPCSCTDPQDKDTSFIWAYRKKGDIYNDIYPSDVKNRYSARVQRVNADTPGNFNMSISGLTVEDEGDYQCRDKNRPISFMTVHLSVEGSTTRPHGASKTTFSSQEPHGASTTTASSSPEPGSCFKNNVDVSMTASSGGSVVLPCSCTDPQDKDTSFIWAYRKKGTTTYNDIYPSDVKNRYSARVQRVNADTPGNFNMSISGLTVEDEGDYQCRDKNRPNSFMTVNLSVEATSSSQRPNAGSKMISSSPQPHGGSITTVGTKPKTGISPESLPFVPFALVTVIFLHIVVAVVYCGTRKK
ncbi:polymeric immunoglobulin receptor-like, partial [Clarias magur]